MSTAGVVEAESPAMATEESALKSPTSATAVSRAFALFGVLLLAKALTLSGRDLPLTLWSPAAFLWQDLLLVVIVAAFDRLVNRRWFGTGLYGMVTLYAAGNVPLIRAVSTPLTWPMLRATSGTLADSIAHYVTVTNVLLLAGVLAAAVLLPRLTVRLPRKMAIAAACLAVPSVCLGPVAVARTSTHGLHRNPVFALVTTAFPRVGTEGRDEEASRVDWRQSPISGQPVLRDPSLLHLRGTAGSKNVVLIILESAGAQYLKPYGASEDPMPFLTTLAQRSVLFENACTVYPESIKGLVAVLSSINPAIDTEAEDYRRIGHRSLAAELSQSGYRTGLFHSGRFMYLGMESVIRDRGFDVLEDAGHISGEHFSSFGVDEPSTVERMLGWIDEGRPDEPFFIAYLPVAGHHPYDSPDRGPFPDAEEIDRYRNALHYCDQSIAGFVRGLKERQLADDTLIVIVGDHGQAFGQHEGNYGHTFFLYEENIRIPLLFAVPGLAEPVRIQRVASSVDVAPTVLDLLGVDLPAEFEGRSLLEPEPRMALFFTDYSQALLGLRDGNWKFLHEVESGRSMLFDLKSDRAERLNVAGQHQERVRACESHLKSWAGCVASVDPRPPVKSLPDQSSGAAQAGRPLRESRGPCRTPRIGPLNPGSLLAVPDQLDRTPRGRAQPLCRKDCTRRRAIHGTVDEIPG